MSQMYLRDSQTVFSAFSGLSAATAAATLRRKRRQSHLINPKKMFEEVRTVIENRGDVTACDVITDIW